MQFAMFIFLKRNWEMDEKYLQDILDYFLKMKCPLQLLMFPEGTDFGPHSLAKSEEYAMKHNLPVYKHVLHPRLRGFTYCAERLRKEGSLHAIYDVTVGYRGNLCQSESDILLGKFPNEVHFHMKRYPIGTIPESIDSLEKWCIQRWVDKEETLEQFYKGCQLYQTQEEKRRENDTWRILHQMILFFSYWVVFLCVVLCLIYKYWWVRLYIILMASILFLQSNYGGGFETLQIRKK